MEILRALDLSEPLTWFLVFHVKPSGKWFDWLSPGRFKHVSAFGYVPGFKSWVLYDAEWRGLRLFVATQDEAARQFQRYVADGCSVLKVERRQEPMPLAMRLIGFHCLSAVAHLVGQREFVISHDQLYRSLLRNGATVIASQAAYRP